MNSTELEHALAERVSLKRLAHCRSTARQTLSLIRRFCPEIPQEAALVTGLWHDAARELDDEALLSFCEARGMAMEEEERADPMLLHGAVAAVELADLYQGCTHAWQLAVRWHTLGSIDMGRLGAALYVADYVEPLRSHLTRQQRLAIVGLSSLEQMCLRIIQEHRAYLARKGKVMARSTARLEQFLADGGRFT